eukprot:968615_1
MEPSDQPSQLPKEVLDAIECPICRYTFSGRIFQCSEGHAICQSCNRSLNVPKRCPFCRVRVGNCRNRALEAVVAALNMSFENEIRGSTEVVSGVGSSFVQAAPEIRPRFQRNISRIDWDLRTRLYVLREEAKEAADRRNR